MIKANGRVVAASVGMLLSALLAGCTTLGDPGPAICHAPDGTMVPVSDPNCPEEVRRALHRDAPPPTSIDQSINNELYNAQHGLVAGDANAR